LAAAVSEAALGRLNRHVKFNLFGVASH